MKVIALLCTLATVAAASPADENEAGKAAMRAGQYRSAAAKFRTAADADPQATYYFNLCAALYQTGAFGPALSACRKVATLAPTAKVQTNTDSLIIKITQDATNQHVSLEPIAEAAAADDLEPGRKLMLLGDYEGAVGEFRAAVARDPRPGAVFDLCLALYQTGQLSRALTACTAVAKHHPTAAVQTKANAHIKLIRDDAKAQHLTLVATPEPGSPADRAEASADQGTTLVEHGELEAARVKFRDAVARDPRAIYFFELCDANYQLGALDEALVACEAVAHHQPSATTRRLTDVLLAKLRR
jgi:tetratricopeptide (TPR) repeat protein